MLSKNFIVCMLLGIALMTGCEKKEIYKGNGPADDKDSFFNYAMKQEVNLSLKYDVPEGFKVYFEAYTQNPLTVDEWGNYVRKEGLTPFVSGYTDSKGNCELPVILPEVASEAYVYSPTAGVPVLLNGEYTNGSIRVTDETVVSDRALGSRAKEYWSNWKSQTVHFLNTPEYDKHGKPQLVNPGLSIDDETLKVIDATIPKGKALELILAQMESISLSEDAGVKLYYIDDNSARKNSLAYFTYTEENIPTKPEDINDKLILVYPNLSRQALRTGDGVELKYFDGKNWSTTFPQGTKIGFVLLVDTWENNSKSVKTTGIQAMYSIRACNWYNIPGSAMANRPQMAVFRAGENIILTFEDQPYTEYDKSPYFGDFRDNIFIIKTDPATALPDVPDGQKPEEPEGHLVMHNSGVLAFEDNWPYEGDYDMNDLVIAYKSSLYLKNFTDITGVADTFYFLHAGAKYTNSFGYVLPTSRTNIERAETDFGYTCNGQGIDQELDEATMMLFDDAARVAPGTRFTVKLWFKEPVTYSFNSKVHRYAPYNPFIVVRGPQETVGWLTQNRREIHLVRDYAPTPKANPDFFHTGKDLSKPEAGFYYVSENNYPFGIDVPDLEHFQYPETESNRIDILYPAFGEWAKSFGANQKDWYLKPARQ